ncbi:type II toxin-antitoxin system mRNA interferase toxin, RelE/StbE family [candidate division WOR-3 bacterium]|nr:type II toxin-antitoxin system mRNA interferase toxin, RelE/StbE family [candidate division WOR-3 bacterium]
MHYRFEIKPKLEKKLKKIQKKDPVMFKVARDKIERILRNPHHYKPLRYGLKGLRRVHIGKSYVRVFEIDEITKTIRFLDLGHHDEIYGKRR